MIVTIPNDSSVWALTSQVDASHKRDVPPDSPSQHSVHSANDPFDHPPLTLIHFVPFPIGLGLSCDFPESVIYFYVGTQ